MARSGRVRRLIAMVSACTALLAGTAKISTAQDAQTAAADLSHAGDFRQRVSAALYLGKTRPEGARRMLEQALDDTHPAVRAAAAAGLGAMGDSAALPALQSHLKSETSGSVKSQIQSSISMITKGPPAAEQHERARYIVEIGVMKNSSGVRGGDVAQVLRMAARQKAAMLPGAMVVDHEAGTAQPISTMPVLLLDGQLTRLSRATSNGTMRVEAQVEFSVRRVPQQTLKGTLSGSASAMEPVRTAVGVRVAELENETIGGAVESAMRGADRGLALAAK